MIEPHICPMFVHSFNLAPKRSSCTQWVDAFLLYGSLSIVNAGAQTRRHDAAPMRMSVESVLFGRITSHECRMVNALDGTHTHAVIWWMKRNVMKLGEYSNWNLFFFPSDDLGESLIAQNVLSVWMRAKKKTNDKIIVYPPAHLLWKNDSNEILWPTQQPLAAYWCNVVTCYGEWDTTTFSGSQWRHIANIYIWYRSNATNRVAKKTTRKEKKNKILEWNANVTNSE